MKYFWAWTDFQSYLDFLLVFSLLTSILTYIFIKSPIFIEMVGFMAVFTEAMLGMPQLFQNYYNKSTRGMRLVVVFYKKKTLISSTLLKIIINKFSVC